MALRRRRKSIGSRSRWRSSCASMAMPRGRSEKGTLGSRPSACPTAVPPTVDSGIRSRRKGADEGSWRLPSSTACLRMRKRVRLSRATSSARRGIAGKGARVRGETGERDTGGTAADPRRGKPEPDRMACLTRKPVGSPGADWTRTTAYQCSCRTAISSGYLSSVSPISALRRSSSAFSSCATFA